MSRPTGAEHCLRSSTGWSCSRNSGTGGFWPIRRFYFHRYASWDLNVFQGPAGRRSQPADATKEDFFASILRSNEVAHADSSRIRRETRVSRERVSHQGLSPLSSKLLTWSHEALDYGLSIVPTKEWQDNLSKRLAYGSSQKACPSDDISVPALQKRRLNNSINKQCDWDSLYKIEPAPGTNMWPFAHYSRLQIYRRRSSKRFRGDGSTIFRWESRG